MEIQPLAVDIPTAAKMVGISAHTLRLYIRRKVLSPVTRCGRRVVVPVSSLESLLKNGAPERTKLTASAKRGAWRAE